MSYCRSQGHVAPSGKTLTLWPSSPLAAGVPAEAPQFLLSQSADGGFYNNRQEGRDVTFTKPQQSTNPTFAISRHTYISKV